MQRLFKTLLMLLLVAPAVASAAQLHLEKSATVVRVGDMVVITLLLDSTTSAINAFEGSLHFSPNLALQDIRYSGSLVPLWVERPEEKETGTVTFVGVFPGGFQEKGNLFTLVFAARRAGIANLSFGHDTKAYLNDGSGTQASIITPAVLSFSILLSTGAPHTLVLDDTTPPEPFTPLIVPGEPFGYSGSVLVFTTQDKDSGILRFDIARSYNRHIQEKDLSWQEVESPYVLSLQDADQYIFVRATDHAQNTYTATVPPQKTSISLFGAPTWFILLFLILLGASLYWYRHLRL